MNRNTVNHFAYAPQLNMQRSRFHRNSGLKTSFNVGQLIPIYLDEVLPGDSWSMKTSKVLRLQTLQTPVMDNMFLDVYYFYVPSRLCWNHWAELMGENSDSAWIPSVEYSVPQLKAPSGGWNVGTIADYFGIPTGVGNLSVSALPFRAYSLICDQWFRDQNNSQPLNIPLTDSDVTGVNTGNYITDTAKGGLPFVVSKYHDYFTSCLPSPQKGPDVALPLGNVAPTFAGELNTDFDFPTVEGSTSHVPMLFQNINNEPDVDGLTGYFNFVLEGAEDSGYISRLNTSSVTPAGIYGVYPTNLYTDLSQATASSINALRTAFQIQRLLEKDAQAGSRYTEVIRAHFSVSSPDARLQRSEYLGGKRIPLNVLQVVNQTGNSAAGSVPLGDVAAMSLTGDVSFDFEKSFTEHGYVLGLVCCRYEHCYQNSLNRMWSRKSRYDFYWPSLAHLGNQAVLNKEIYAQGVDPLLYPDPDDAPDNQVFGYQEVWADYRFKPSLITGEMRSVANKDLDIWHFGDDYSSMPYLSDDWIREDKSNVDRCLSVTSSVANQIFGDFYFEVATTRCMPLYGVPGLIDHF